MESVPVKENNAATMTITVELMSFGWKYGPPTDTAHNINVRSFPNPPAASKKGGKNGLHKDFRDLVFATQKAQDHFYKVKEEVMGLIDLEKQKVLKEEKEGLEEEEEEEEEEFMIKIGIGCHSGKHRSVSIVERMAHEMVNDCRILTSHRDISKGRVKEEKAKRRNQYREKFQI